MANCDDRPWKLIAPWWRWPKLVPQTPGAPKRDVRSTRPVVQKYDTSDPVSLFVKEPQKSLLYGDDDIVQKVVAGPDVKPSKTLSRYSLQPTGVRKLFLPTHKRFYLVVCELHCDQAGLPSVSRDKVCEAGFVVRRCRLSFRREHAALAAELVQKAGALTAQLAKVERSGQQRVLKKRHRVTKGGVFGAMAGAALAPAKSKLAQALDASTAAKRAELQTQLAAVRADIAKWKVDADAVTLAEGWVPSGTENVGSWQVVGETPEEVTEQVYPLYPLVADPRTAGHDAEGKTLYFGMLPVSSREVEAGGTARFDDASRYQVRCYVRRHRCDCPKTGERNDCGGELVWSEASDVFQLAAPFDPVGTGNHPVTIQLPDIPALAATVGARLPVQMVSPAGSAMSFQVDDDKPVDGRLGELPQICFISIPLITIVATFVFMLFLPIVVFVFQLWFLLGLRFCILPSVSFSAGAELHADIEGELGLHVGAELDVLLAADIGLAGLGDSGLKDTNFDGTLDTADLQDPAFADSDSPPAQIRAAYTTEALRSLRDQVATDRSDEVEAGSVLVGLAYEPRVERWEVGA
ncbi:MAG TPA: hypothetical protein VF746_25855 [Longimicrobium sp.]|jgi:hypothetical protein